MKKVSRTALNYPTAPASSSRATQPASTATKEEVARLIQDLSRLVSEKPEKAAVILTDWLDRCASSSNSILKKTA